MTEGNLQLEVVYNSEEEQSEEQEQAWFLKRKEKDYKKPNAIAISIEEIKADKELLVQANTLKMSTAQNPQNGQTTPNLMYYIAQLTVQKPSHCHLCPSKFNTQPMVLFSVVLMNIV